MKKAALILPILFIFCLVYIDEISSVFIDIGGVYERTIDFSTPFKTSFIKIKAKVIAKKQGYVQFKVLESGSWMDPVGSIRDKKSFFFFIDYKKTGREGL